MWSYDRPVQIEKPLVAVPWRSIGFYALTGKSVITYKERLVKETIIEALEEIPKQNSRGRILLVADNYGSHHAKLTQQQADELGIEFVFIPPYSPTLNAIEPLWKDVKRETSPTIFEDKDHFRPFLTKTFLRLSQRLSFAGDWIETFLPDIQVLQVITQRRRSSNSILTKPMMASTHSRVAGGCSKKRD
ncbi:transposase [Natribaculum luteum]|uniref:Transposase n=1 Tax=Natribaculum luteum TaxID=1586232 RepID=A0ABD5P393_9EURY|nr:transposase [Natribaculum luteum]